MSLRIFICLILPFIFACNPTGSNLPPAGEPIPPGGHLHIASKAIGLVAGEVHVCAHLDNYAVKCWGDNSLGALNMQSARNIRKKYCDVSNSTFSKIAANYLHTCGILKSPILEGIPMCWGEEGEWLDVPHEKVKDIATSAQLTCYIKQNDTLACVGADISAFIDGRGAIRIKAAGLLKWGIDPISGAEGQDFSSKKFKNIKIGYGKVCARGLDDDIVYCLGDNRNRTGQLGNDHKLDYQPINSKYSYVILDDGKLRPREGFAEIPSLVDPAILKFKKIIKLEGFLTASGNFYDNGAPIPENTLITLSGVAEEGILDFALAKSSHRIKSFPVACFLTEQQKVRCQPYPKSTEKTEETGLINNIPKEIAE